MKNGGFTLVELLVVVGVMATLVALILPQFSKFNKEESLQTAAANVQTALRTAQNNALSGVKCDSDAPAASWQFKFSNNASYYITVPASTNCSPTPISYTLPADVVFSSIDIGDCTTVASGDGSNLSGFSISYGNIGGAVTFENTNPGCPVSSFTTQMGITMRLQSNPAVFAKIIVEKGGGIYLSSN